MNETRILVVDDEEDLCEILKFNLETKVMKWIPPILPKKR